MSKQTDVVIIGAGPAGLSAATYCGWLGLKTTVLEAGIPGGRAYLAPKLENYPGFPEGIKGSELVEKMQRQAERFKAQIKSDEEVVGIETQGAQKRVISRKQTYDTKALIIATGTQHRKLRVPGEAEYLGRGVSYCATCDGPLFRRKTVVVVGNGEEAAIDALALADLAGKVVVVSEDLKVEGALIERIKTKPNVEFQTGKVTEIVGNHIVEAIKLQNTQNQMQEIKVQGVFVALGGVPLTAIVQKAGITTDRTGCLTVNRHQQTNAAGVYAAGDCTCGGMQVATAVGEGALAAMRASAYIRRSAT
jgi:thioredoxin reductase (NADPH)